MTRPVTPGDLPLYEPRSFSLGMVREFVVYVTPLGEEAEDGWRLTMPSGRERTYARRFDEDLVSDINALYHLSDRERTNEGVPGVAGSGDAPTAYSLGPDDGHGAPDTYNTQENEA